MKLYSGFDLHANNTYIGIKDENGKRLMKGKVNNDPDLILQKINPIPSTQSSLAFNLNFSMRDLLMPTRVWLISSDSPSKSGDIFKDTTRYHVWPADIVNA